MSPGFHISLPHPAHHLDLTTSPQDHTLHHRDTVDPSRFTLHHAATLPIPGSSGDHSHYSTHRGSTSNSTSSGAAHVDTPHPHFSASPAKFFQQHGHEFSVNNSFHQAKHDASGVTETAIPELDETVIEHARLEHEAEKAQRKEAERKRCVSEAEQQWKQISAKREAARHRTMSVVDEGGMGGLMESPGSDGEMRSEREDEW